MDLSLTYLIVDDEELSQMAIAHEAEKYPFLKKMGVCDNATDALATIASSVPDILFSDIEMPGMNGIEMMKQLLGNIPAPVFITSHPEYALESFDLEIFDYILKPIDTQRFHKCILRIHEFFLLHQKAMQVDNQNEGTDFIIIKQGYEKFKVPFVDILFLEAMKDYTKIQTDKQQNYLVLESISGLLLQLPKGKFQRIHRSYAVNRHKITHYTPNKLWLEHHEFPIGKSYRNIVASW